MSFWVQVEPHPADAGALSKREPNYLVIRATKAGSLRA